jgi:hypothetical protein
MPCACKDKDALAASARGIARSNPRPDQEGIYQLREAPDCNQAYSGAFRAATVFIVGYGTEHETVYRRGERKTAIDHARQAKLTIDQVPARALCHDTMLTLLGA